MKRSDLITVAVLLTIIVVVGLFAWLRSSAPATTPYESLTETERNFIATPYQTTTGEVVRLANFAGDVLVVNAWASWCPFCVAELPDLQALAHAYQGAGVQVVAINRAEPAKTAVSYLASVNVETTGPLHVWLDENDAFYHGIGGFTMPETVIYASDGTVFLHKRGFMTLAEMEQHVEYVLAASASAL